MATKSTTKKKATSTKTTEAETVIPSTEAKKVEEKAVLTRYKFIAHCSNINISNVIFNNIKVVIYETDSPTYEAAFDKFQNAVMNMFNGDVNNYNTFMGAVFGDDILVEAVKVDQIKEDIAVLN